MFPSTMTSSLNFLSTSSVSATLRFPGSEVVKEMSNSSVGCIDETKERIKKMFEKTELSVSAYDTAWVAMVPAPNSSQRPCFPECSNWIMDNQLEDGSWGLPDRHPLLIKDAVNSTLACILALKRWGVGEQQMKKGLEFIELNSPLIADKTQHNPIGFDIIFPAMVEYAKEMNLNLHLKSIDVDAMIHQRDLELQRGYGSSTEGRKAYLAYISEGVGKAQDWEMVMKHQRENGSLFNSPSTTAAVLIHLQNADCFHYLSSLLEKFGNAVPTIYPRDIYSRLHMVDTLQRLGIDRHFRKEIQAVLDETSRYWMQGKEEIFLDLATCAMAFRILRVGGYDVASDKLTNFTEDRFLNSLEGYLKDMGAVLELYKASQLMYPKESFLERQYLWTNNMLKDELVRGSVCVDRLGEYITNEVHDALSFNHHGSLDRISNRRAIARYIKDSTRILKSSYSCSTIGNEDFLKLAVEDFNICQSIQQKELNLLGRWVMDNKLDKLMFARQKLGYCYFSGAATSFAPELADARMSWAKNGVLTTVIDDFYDVGSSEEERLNLIHLIEKWDGIESTDICSEKVGIIFSALHSTISEIGDRSCLWQGRNIKSHVTKIWLNLLKSMNREAEWTKDKSVPTLDEYMTNAYVSFALGPIVLPAIYFVGPKLPEEIDDNSELHNLYKVMSTCGRLLNDWRGFKRESDEGKLNTVSLLMMHSNLSEEEAIEKIKDLIDDHRKQLLRLVSEEKDSVIPRPCKDLFWKMIRVLNMFYMKDDGFTSDEMMSIANNLFHEAISYDKLGKE